MSLLFNPSQYDPKHLDEHTRAKLLSLVKWFEDKGHDAMMDDFATRAWYQDFLDYNAQEGIFSTFATPSAVGELLGGAEGAEAARWDTARINELNEILGFYSLAHWYTWQVSVLGLGPIWMSKNDEARAEVGKLLESGAIFGFGLSERTHGADIYSTDMILTRTESGWSATGGKYYIGNGNEAGRVSVFGQFADDDPEHPGEYVFFLVDPKHDSYELVKNVVDSQMYVAQFNLHDYPVTRADILHVGSEAWDAALGTVNVGKVNLGWASIGICEHAFYESIEHAHNRVLYGNRVTDFPHVRRMLVDAYVRLVAMKAYAARSADYFRTASEEDRRFLLFNPITKMKVTSEGEDVINLLWEVIAARGFEKDMYFSRAAGEIRALPKLEGTVHVNLALVLKFLPAYLGAAVGAGQEYPEIGVRDEAGDDAYLFEQGPAKGLSRIKFANWRPALERFGDLPNVSIFLKQIESFGAMVMSTPPNESQQKDLDFLLTLGQMFTQVVYAQLVSEAVGMALDNESGKRADSVSSLDGITEQHLDRMFAIFVQDMSKHALDLHNQASATAEQRAAAMRLVQAPVIDAKAEDDLVAEVTSLDGAYRMAR